MIERVSLFEARVLGVLLEKEITTPEVYPMTVNAILSGCNQKSNREPVLSLSAADVVNTLDLLQKRHWVLKMPGARSVKYKQRFCNTEFSAFQFTDQERAVICSLLLRGPQTAGELRARCMRLADFADAKEMEACLKSLESREMGGLVRSLEREPGRRECRYTTTFVENEAIHSVEPVGRDEHMTTLSSNSAHGALTRENEILARIEALEERVNQLEALMGRGGDHQQDKTPDSDNTEV